MTTKIICIDHQHAECIHANDSFKSVMLGRAVVMDIDPTDDRIPGLLRDGLAYQDEVTEFDRGELYGKPTEAN